MYFSYYKLNRTICFISKYISKRKKCGSPVGFDPGRTVYQSGNDTTGLCLCSILSHKANVSIIGYWRHAITDLHDFIFLNVSIIGY